MVDRIPVHCIIRVHAAAIQGIACILSLCAVAHFVVLGTTLLLSNIVTTGAPPSVRASLSWTAPRDKNNLAKNYLSPLEVLNASIDAHFLPATFFANINVGFADTIT
jgi:hypothetical protein